MYRLITNFMKEFLGEIIWFSIDRIRKIPICPQD